LFGPEYQEVKMTPSPAKAATPAKDKDEFTPKLLSQLREGYPLGNLRADVMAGLTVAIVALPLSMAIAIASGVGPERGLFTAIVGGFLVSLLGGSRFQIGGPAGAFIVLVAACVTQTGVQGLVLATLLSGVMLTGLALLRLGSYVRFIPYPVTLGFTAGIAVIIFASQIKDLFGLSLTGEPAAIIPKVQALWAAGGTLNASAAMVAVVTIALIIGLKRLAPALPNMLIAVAVTALAAFALQLPVETIYSRFGELPRSPPAPSLPPMSMDLVLTALPWAASFTLLGAIESLLSAVVADGMSGRRHRPNAELLAQGVANIGSALFGGICVTGTIARTATNVRAGSKGPVSGMLHALFVLLFMLIAAPLAGYIPLAALAGVLAVVAWNMAEKVEIWDCLRSSRADAVVLLATLLLVVFRDLTEGIVTGFALGGLVFIHRMSEAASVEAPVTEGLLEERGIAVHRLHGPYFFGAAARLGAALDQLAESPRGLAVDFTDVPFIDSTGAHSFELLAQKMARKHEILYLIGARPEVARALVQAGVTAPHAQFLPDLKALPQS
jgi:sulfate permease, SulP family